MTIPQQVVEGSAHERSKGNTRVLGPGEYQLDPDNVRRDQQLAKREIAAMRGFLGR